MRYHRQCRENELILLENLVTRRVSEEDAAKSSLTRRVTKQGHLLLAALVQATAMLANAVRLTIDRVKK